jgi:hypothetical protein
MKLGQHQMEEDVQGKMTSKYEKLNVSATTDRLDSTQILVYKSMK